jgi:hypothetical protein
MNTQNKTNSMKVLLTSNYIYISPFVGYRKDYQSYLDFKQWVKDNQGKWVDIDTDYIFDNKYNTIDGKRIYDTWVDKIENDIREGVTECKYCGKYTNGKICTKTEKCKEYGIKTYSSKNVFFLKFPNGKDKIKKVDFYDHLKNPRFSSCYSVNQNYYRISRRNTIEFILVGTEIYITNNIGYTHISKSGLSENEKTITKYCANRIINL